MNASPRRTWLAGMLAVLCAPRLARAADFLSQPVTLIVPYSAGGATDVLVRAIAEAAAKVLGQRIVVENRPGAAGVLGANTVMRAVPDGHTLTIMPEATFRMPYLQKTAFDPLKDFTYVARLFGYLLGAAVRADAPWKTWGDFVADARRRPGAISYGSTGVNGTIHVTMEDICQRLGIKLNHVPYKGESEIIAALMGGHLDMGITAASIGTFVDGGKARWLVLWLNQRSRRWPDVPTLRDVGIDMDATSPVGVAGPRGMDAKVVRQLSAAFRAALEDPAVRATLERLDQEAAYLDSAAYDAFAREHHATQGQLVKRLGLTSTP
ncbi:tripartite tricarboxylate transporter substrate binding protein [Alicycliphilus sp. T452]|jgi:tripartite-type tricarboxylate transporter receptor subunit TctC